MAWKVSANFKTGVKFIVNVHFGLAEGKQNQQMGSLQKTYCG